MNPVLAVCMLIAAGLAILWGVQSLLLIANGEKPAPLLRYRTEKPWVVYPMKVMIQLSWLWIILGYPLLIGVDIPVFYGRAFGFPAPKDAMVILAAACVAGFIFINTVNGLAGGVEFTRRFGTARTIRRVIGCFITPVPLAIMEEAVFRGVVLHALLQVLEGPVGIVIAVALSSALFSSVHFIRRRDARKKPALQPAIGLFFVGIALGTAYVAGGQTLWGPIALHAAGILGTELPRSFVIYRANPVWVGYRSFPHSGPLGLLHMLALALLAWYLLAA